MTTTSSVSPVIRLHRSWTGRLADAWVWLRAAFVAARARRRARRDHDDALELDEATLRDMGAPPWLQEQARFRRELRQFERALMRSGVDRW